VSIRLGEEKASRLKQILLRYEGGPLDLTKGTWFTSF
jgi:hypothetical protein